jgi:hypothetical protein
MSEASDAVTVGVDDPSYTVNHRAWVRSPVSQGATCQPLTAPSQEFLAARVQNVSAGGIGLVLNRRLARGTVLQVVLEGREGQGPRNLLARVVHDSLLTAYPGLRWLVGCALLTRLTAEELQALVA